MRATGVDTEYPVFLFQGDQWFEAPEVNNLFSSRLRRWLDGGGSVHQVVRSCERFQARSIRLFRRLAEKEHTLDSLRTIYHVLGINTSFIWLAHGFEDVYSSIARVQARKIFKGDVERFIGDISFPSKLTAHAKFERAMRRGALPTVLVERFGWLRNRDGFSPPFNVREIARAQERLRRQQPERRHARSVPASLRRLATILQECVYFRTLRTDTFFELLFRAQPVFRSIAKRYEIPYQRLRYYSLDDVTAGRPHDYSSTVTFIGTGGVLHRFKRKLLTQATVTASEVRGNVAYPGTVRGTVRVILRPDDLSKVREGDILVTNMTTPAFILGMKRSAAFVTDEGGLTCHAAIVAREMKKPCIIGTKVATKVFKDGDRVEVDATRGIVRKVNQ
ncbi:MAG: hypothetical protein HYZ09_00750 [Candidatus Kerfeldbacteria bacterium]|nr:hypothetical protein [Candidatus Kerfeldbacteria bacterium]